MDVAQKIRMGVRYPIASEDKGRAPTGAMAQWSGETRAPKAGEWFLSGAEIEAYRQPHYYDRPRPIATIVVPKTTVTTWEEVKA